ncbi:MAG: hypothetical protein H0T89_21945 [Deltaproteobacteria bacterium]|nr:hypothetical protein [Deltaproteobacteria bacterium]MDQ3297828.1 hypothetical protein [Myxococcota bacterium]
MRLICLVTILACAACGGDPDTVRVELSPSVISSLDGTTVVSAIVSDGTTPLEDQPVQISIVYKDRNGTSHDVAPVEGRTDERGVFHATLMGLVWDGIGTVTVSTAPEVSGTATFSVLDRTPPKIEILPPTTDKRVGPGLPLDVQVRVTDEIGVSQVTLDGTSTIDGGRTTLIASGTQETTLTFRMQVDAGATPGPTITLHALASDLSGNLATATAMTLTVDPAITIATPPGLTGNLLADGTAQRLVDPRAIVRSLKDGKLYIADHAGTGACSPSCIWRVDATTGAIDTAPVVVGIDLIEGVALDALADNLYYSDRQNRTRRLTWNGTAYATPVDCNDSGQQRPADPFHLIFDAALGLLAADDNDKDVVRVATCTTTTQGQVFSNGNYDSPRGIAAGPAGELYVSDFGRDLVTRVDRTNGAVTVFQNDITEPYGMDWVAGTTSWANSLLVASFGDRVIESTKAPDPSSPPTCGTRRSMSPSTAARCTS